MVILITLKLRLWSLGQLLLSIFLIGITEKKNKATNTSVVDDRLFFFSVIDVAQRSLTRLKSGVRMYGYSQEYNHNVCSDYVL